MTCRLSSPKKEWPSSFYLLGISMKYIWNLQNLYFINTDKLSQFVYILTAHLLRSMIWKKTSVIHNFNIKFSLQSMLLIQSAEHLDVPTNATLWSSSQQVNNQPEPVSIIHQPTNQIKLLVGHLVGH